MLFPRNRSACGGLAYTERSRSVEADLLLGDPTKAKTQLGWTPEYDLQGLVQDMMIGDIALVNKA